VTFYVSATWALFRLVRRHDLLVAKTDPPLISVPASWVAAVRGARLANWLQDLFPEVPGALGLRVARGLTNIQFRPYQPRDRLGGSLGVADVHLVVLRPELEGLIVPSKVQGSKGKGQGARDGRACRAPPSARWSG